MAAFDRLRGPQEKAALLLAAGASLQAVADSCEVSDGTLRRWRKEESFRFRVAELRAEMSEEAIGLFARSAAEATAELRKLLRNRKPALRMAAAKALLELAPKFREWAEVEARLLELERQVRENGSHAGRLGEAA